MFIEVYKPTNLSPGSPGTEGNSFPWTSPAANHCNWDLESLAALEASLVTNGEMGSSSHDLFELKIG
jgi:hypothetical protein